MIQFFVAHRPLQIGLILAAICAPVFAGDTGAPQVIWNATTASDVTYNAITPTAKAGDWVYVDAHKVHPTQICLGYRESAFRAKELSELNTDPASKDAKTGLYPHLAKKDVPIIIAPDGTPFITDGHHTLSGLLDSTQKDKRAFGHIEANFYQQPEAAFLAYITDPAKNDCYLFGPNGNAFTGAPAAYTFAELPHVLTGADADSRMADDQYRSLGWAMKDSGFVVKKHDGAEDPTMENFIEFRWADLFRNKIIWNDKSDPSFNIAVANAEALAHSELTHDLSGGFSAADRPGFVPAKAGKSFEMNLTNETYINGDITPSPKSKNILNVNANHNTALLVSGRLENFSSVTINAGGNANPIIETGKVDGSVKIPAGDGIVIFPAENQYNGTTWIRAGSLVVNGSTDHSAMTVDANATLSGSGEVASISGAGLISPGSTVGILTTSMVDPSAGTTFAFELTAPAKPDWAHPLKSKNDVLRIRAEKPFASPLTSDNHVKVFLNSGALHEGDAFIGGFFADTSTPFDSAVTAGDFEYFTAAGDGAESFGGVQYKPVDSSKIDVKLSVIPCDAAFTSAPAHGYVTKFTIAMKDPAAVSQSK